MLDLYLLLLTRTVRMFSFGAIATVLFMHLESLGMAPEEIGLLFSCTVFGDLIMSIPLTTRADKWGRKRVLMISAGLKIGSGLVFATMSNRGLLLIAAILGVITPTGGEIGPFMAVEQAALTAERDESSSITMLYSVYNFVGFFAQALGALVAGFIVGSFEVPQDGYRAVFYLFTCAAIIKVGCYSLLSSNIEAKPETLDPPSIALTDIKEETSDAEEQLLDPVVSSANNADNIRNASAVELKNQRRKSIVEYALRLTGLKHVESLRLVTIISILFVIDAFAGGLIMPTVIVGWFEKQFNVSPEWLGALISGINVLAGISALLVIPLSRFGALNVAVFSHIPSNILQIFVPFMPTSGSAAGMLLARSALSQMDTPARQAFVATSVAPNERSAAGGITMIVRSLGIVASPIVWGPMISSPAHSLMFAMPFVLGGALKIIYDILLYFSFRNRTEGYIPST